MLFRIKLKITISAGILLTLCLAPPAESQRKELHKYSLALGYAPQTLVGGESGNASPHFVVSPGFNGSAGRRISSHMRFRMDFFSTTVYSDSLATSSFQIGSSAINRVSGFRSRRVTIGLQYFPLEGQRRFSPSVGLGVGVDAWKFIDAATDSTLSAINDRNIPASFEAHEFVVATFVGLDVALTSSLALSLEGRAVFLTDLGAEFASSVNSARPSRAYSVSTRLQFSFGSSTKHDHWRSDKTWAFGTATKKSEPVHSPRDSDGDGVADDIDKCPSTAAGAIVNSLGCPMDSDGDGVYDGLDDCPDTPPGALGAVDIHGCPIDSDFDGVADYSDACPAGPVGAHVDEKGCPLDGDGDGVADGLDDCPQTITGLTVDERGCVDMSLFAQAMVLNIGYESGSFEVDSKSKVELQQLALMLKAASNVHLEIIGYTDNIGAAQANRTLSEKRARRVRDYLRKLGVASERMTVRGRGETNFIADNSTAKGRQQNRRIEILFQRR
jgi:OmpA-OmpF porin, OOP family